MKDRLVDTASADERLRVFLKDDEGRTRRFVTGGRHQRLRT